MSLDGLKNNPKRTAIGLVADCRAFTLIEVLLAASIMIVLCVGTLSVFSYATNINRANNLRSQGLTILQDEAEYYRGLKFKRGYTDALLNAGTYDRGTKTSGDGTTFTVSVTITNMPNVPGGTAPADSAATLKQIKLTAQRQGDTRTWYGSAVDLTILRVKAN